MIAALFVLKNGPYVGLPNIDAWDVTRDAKKYKGPWPVIAHPPCERWGRYWSGGPSAKVKRILGDDGGCFLSALKSVRKYGGVLEHPEASHAFKKYKLPRPGFNGGWTDADKWGGRSCCVAQGHYGHQTQKMTWLYAVLDDYPELKWGRFSGGKKIDLGSRNKKKGIKLDGGRLSKKQRTLTPLMFRDLLIEMVINGRHRKSPVKQQARYKKVQSLERHKSP